MSYFDGCQLTLIWLANDWQPCPALFRFYIELVSVTYISLYVGAKRLVFHLSPRDGRVIIVSGCPILTAVNLIVLVRMAYITERLVELCKIYCHIWHRLTWSVCTGGRADVRYVVTKFSWMDSLPNFVTMVLRCARFACGRATLIRSLENGMSRAFIAKLSRAKGASGAPWVRKWSNLSARENLVIMWPYSARPPASPRDRPFAPQAYQCKIYQSTGMATQMQLEVILARNRIATDVL